MAQTGFTEVKDQTELDFFVASTTNTDLIISDETLFNVGYDSLYSSRSRENMLFDEHGRLLKSPVTSSRPNKSQNPQKRYSRWIHRSDSRDSESSHQSPEAQDWSSINFSSTQPIGLGARLRILIESRVSQLERANAGLQKLVNDRAHTVHLDQLESVSYYLENGAMALETQDS